MDYDFLDESIANPSYCSQAPLCDASLRGSKHNNAGNDLYNQNDSDNQNADACSLNNPEDAAAPDQLVLGVTEEVEEDIWLTPPVPYAGQTFSSKQEDREFYNSYVKRIGFSIRTNCTHLSGVIRE